MKTIDLYREFKNGSRSMRFLYQKDEESRFGIYGWDYPTWARIKDFTICFWKFRIYLDTLPF